MAKLGPEFATLFQLVDERFYFGPKRTERSLAPSAKASISLTALVIFDVN